jgi:excinuclease UvrABC ATPase subunit
MKTLVRIAVIAFAGFGVLAQAQEYTKKFNAVKREMDGLMESMKYVEVIEKGRVISPAEIPHCPKHPAYPQSAVNSYTEIGSILDFYEVLYKALHASGDTEGAIACIKKAEDIAKMNAADTEAALAPTISVWSAAMDDSAKNMEENGPVKEQLEAEKNRLESMPKRKKADNKLLEDIVADLDSLAKDMAVWENNLKTAPAVLSQLNRYIDTAKKDAAKFANEIKDLESDLANEADVVDSKFKGDKAKYAAAALPNAGPMDPKDRVRFLNRLLFLDPNSAAARKQLDAALASI